MDCRPIFYGIKFVQSADCSRVSDDREDGAGNDPNPPRGDCKKKPDIQLVQAVEADEVYIVAGHKGQPEKVEKSGRPPRRRRLKGHRGRGTSASEKPPVLGLVQRDGSLILRALDNVQQATIRPVILHSVQQGSLIYTDEYNIYDRLEQWGFRRKSVCHAQGEYARDEDEDGFCEVHVNTQEGIWSVLRSWLRPHRGVSMDKLPLYLGFFEFVFNTKRRGNALIQHLFETILGPDLRRMEQFALSPE